MSALMNRANWLSDAERCIKQIQGGIWTLSEAVKVPGLPDFWDSPEFWNQIAQATLPHLKIGEDA